MLQPFTGSSRAEQEHSSVQMGTFIIAGSPAANRAGRCSGSHSCLCLQHFSDLATTFAIPAQVPRAAGSPECGSSRDRSRAQGWTCPLCAPAGRKIHRTQLTNTAQSCFSAALAPAPAPGGRGARALMGLCSGPCPSQPCAGKALGIFLNPKIFLNDFLN